MKTLNIAVLSFVMFSGYSLAESTSLNTVKEYMAAWNAHDASRAAQYLADDAVYYDAAAGEPVNGREKAEKEVIGAFIKAVPDLNWKMHTSVFTGFTAEIIQHEVDHCNGIVI